MTQMTLLHPLPLTAAESPGGDTKSAPARLRSSGSLRLGLLTLQPPQAGLHFGSCRRQRQLQTAS